MGSLHGGLAGEIVVMVVLGPASSSMVPGWPGGEGLYDPDTLGRRFECLTNN